MGRRRRRLLLLPLPPSLPWRRRCALGDDCALLALLLLLLPGRLRAFNVDREKVTVYSGPDGSYFGYALDFYSPAPHTVSVLVGAPKANTSQPDIVEGGAVYYCPWPALECKPIPFDNTNSSGLFSEDTWKSTCM